MVPATIVAGKTVTIRNGIEIEQDGEEYCRLLIKTKHKEQINCCLYLDDKVITGGADKMIKIYRIQGTEALQPVSEDDEKPII